MRNLPFFLPEQDVGLNAIRILAVIDSFTDGRVKKIDIENVALMVVLVRNPNFLKKVLLSANEMKIYLKEYEDYSINSQVPVLNDIYKNRDTKKIVSALVNSGFLAFSLGEENEVLLELTESGKKIIEDHKSDYVERIKGYSKHLKFMRSKSVGVIHSAINKVLKGQL
ncbi:MAG: hypothetical protein JNM12_15375 [Alphaproteobacteria bacterium]|nr:hypothetical protein [Alphaproteobacteria bacterium]